MQFSKLRARASGSRRELSTKVLALVCLTLISLSFCFAKQCLTLVSGNLIAHTVQSFRYATPGWVALRELRSADEFHLKNFSDQLDLTGRENRSLRRPSVQVITKDRFNLTPPAIEEYFVEIEPMWSCKDPNALQGRKKKLVYLHVYQTVGSPLRALLQEYAHMCHAGIALVLSCTWVSMQSLEQGYWQNGDARHHSKCQMRRAVSRDTIEFKGMRLINTSFLETNVDILAGSLPIGSAHTWKDDTGERVDVQYMTFVRDPVYKYVSGILFNHPGLEMNETTALIKETVSKAVKDGSYFDKYSTSFIMPIQRAVFDQYNIQLTPEERANLAIKNLAYYNVLIGITERMSESFKMLQHVLDEDGALDQLFESFGEKDADGNVDEKGGNMSRLSTEKIVAELEIDADFMQTMREYVKYEEKIRQFALAMHLRQYESFQSRTATPGIPKTIA